MAPNTHEILAPETTMSVSLEPAHNALNSLMMLNIAEEYSGLGAWVTETAAALSLAQKHNQRLIFECLCDVVLTESSWPSFSAYLEDLAAQDPQSLRDRALRGIRHSLEKRSANTEQSTLPDPLEVLSDRDLYLELMENLHCMKEKEFNRELYAEAHALLNDPPAMQGLIISHLRMMWEEALAAEWQRVKPLLQESVEAFQAHHFTGKSVPQAIRFVIGRDLRIGDMRDELTRAERIIFIPSAHVGPYVSVLSGEKTIRLVFGARVPEGVRAHSPALSRSELLIQLSALVDDTRLRILELLTEHDSVSSQEIIERLELSQSSASRHLIQLSAAGFLIERRQERSKCYCLNRERIEATLHALKTFLQRK